MPKLYSRIDENVLRHNITYPLLILIKKINNFWNILNTRNKKQNIKIEELEKRIKTLETLVLKQAIGIN